MRWKHHIHVNSELLRLPCFIYTHIDTLCGVQVARQEIITEDHKPYWRMQMNQFTLWKWTAEAKKEKVSMDRSKGIPANQCLQQKGIDS